MTKLIWACLLVDTATIIFLLGATIDPNQDSAGKGMLFLPLLILIGIVGGGYLLMQHDMLGWALAVTGLPVIVILFFVYVSFT